MDKTIDILATDWAAEAVGYALAFVLAFLSFALLPKEERHRGKQGAGLLVVSIVASAARFALAPEQSFRRSLVFTAVFCLMASISRSAILLVLDVAIGSRRERKPPKIFRDLATGLAYIAVALLALRSIDIEPGSILTTSALLTAVVGLALQDTLGNLVSGLALQTQRPFDVGDWIEVDNGVHTGRVTEVTWRATSISTLDHVEVILPNAWLAKAAIRNYSRPSKVSRRKATVGVSFASSPATVHEVLRAAAIDVPGVLAEPKPFVRTRAFGESAIEYEVLYYVDDFARGQDIDSAVRDRVFYAFARRGIEIPFPTRAVVVPSSPTAKETLSAERTRRLALVRNVPLFEPLPDDSRDVLVARARLLTFGPGEIIVRKGDPSDDMYLVEEGTVTVELPRDEGGSTELAQLGPGEWFGEMGLLAGEPRTATVRAVTLCNLLVIDHGAFQDVLAAHPEIVDRMGQLLAERQAALEAAGAVEQAPPAERSRRFVTKIRSWFKMG